MIGIFALGGEKQMDSKCRVKICDDDSMYTRISNYVEWIRDNADRDYCDN